MGIFGHRKARHFIRKVKPSKDILGIIFSQSPGEIRSEIVKLEVKLKLEVRIKVKFEVSFISKLVLINRNSKQLSISEFAGTKIPRNTLSIIFQSRWWT